MNSLPTKSLLFGWHDAHPVVLGKLILEAFGKESLEWESQALRQSIIKELGAKSISVVNWQKIEAFRSLLVSSSCWEAWEVFENIILALNNVIPDPTTLQKCSIAQLLNGVNIVNKIRKETWSEEVYKYIGACAMDQGVHLATKPIGRCLSLR